MLRYIVDYDINLYIMRDRYFPPCFTEQCHFQDSVPIESCAAFGSAILRAGGEHALELYGCPSDTLIALVQADDSPVMTDLRQKMGMVPTKPVEEAPEV